jgi:hypothetical protein
MYRRYYSGLLGCAPGAPGWCVTSSSSSVCEKKKLLFWRHYGRAREYRVVLVCHLLLANVCEKSFDLSPT